MFLAKIGKRQCPWGPNQRKKEFSPDYEYVYDMTVSGSHNFIASLVFVIIRLPPKMILVKADGRSKPVRRAASGGMVMVDEFDKMECLMGDTLVCSGKRRTETPFKPFLEEVKKKEELKDKKGTSVRGIQNRFVLSMDKTWKWSNEKCYTWVFPW